MQTDEIIIRIFCIVDEQLADVKKRSDAHLYPSEIVTIGLIFALRRCLRIKRVIVTHYGHHGTIAVHPLVVRSMLDPLHGRSQQ